MSERRRGRRRRRPSAGAGAAQPDPAAESDASAPSEARSGYGKAALALALLLGILIEQIASDVIPANALDVFHLAVVVGIAFFVARWYRGYMRRALARRRETSRR